MSEPRERRVLSLDDVMRMLSEIAEAGSGTERMQALKMIAAQRQDEILLPEPKTEQEAIECAAKLLMGLGNEATRAAYRLAFGHREYNAPIDAPPTSAGERCPVSNADTTKLPNTLRELRGRWPNYPRKGKPIGYPQRASSATRREWCHREALRLMREDEQARQAALGAENGRDAKGDQVEVAKADEEVPA